MAQQGGGVTYHKDCNTYIDLIVGNLSDIENEYPQVTDLFRAFAKHTQGQANFGFAELDRDKRLFSILSETELGQQLYNTLLRNVPLITVSNSILGNLTNTANVKLFPLSELNENPLITLNTLYDAARAGTRSGGAHLIDRLDLLNRIISVKPGLFGISLDINKIFQTWIDQKRARA